MVDIRAKPANGKAFQRKRKETSVARARATIRAGQRVGRYIAPVQRVYPSGELKFHDIDWDEAAADISAGVISNTSSLVLIGQGVTDSTRIGRKAVIKSIGWRGQIQLVGTATAAATVPEIVRLILVLDTQANGAAPAVTGADGLLASANYQSFNNLTNKGRFTVLRDEVFDMNPLVAAGNGTTNDFGAVNKSFTFFHKCNIPIEYSGTAAPSVITELRTNNIFGIMINKTTATNTILDSKFRFRFTD